MLFQCLSDPFFGLASRDRREFEIGSGSWATKDSLVYEVILEFDLQWKRCYTYGFLPRIRVGRDHNILNPAKTIF